VLERTWSRLMWSRSSGSLEAERLMEGSAVTLGGGAGTLGSGGSQIASKETKKGLKKWPPLL
jgi:hypothetical protein